MTEPRLPREQQRCANCSAFVRKRNTGQGAGECRGNYPSLMATMVPNTAISLNPGQMQQGVAAVWPPMREDEWCRRWE